MSLRLSRKEQWRKAFKDVDGSPAARRDLVRHLNKTDLFYLLVVTLNRIDADNDFCYGRCREVEDNPNGYMDLWSREHYKSSIITFALTIQDLLKDPDLTVCIFSHTKPIAKNFLRQIKVEFESNESLKAHHSDVLYWDPRREAPKWSEDDGITIKRKSTPKEATIYASGLVDGLPTSGHYGLLIYDDVVTKESVYTPEQIQRTTDAWELSLPIGTEGGLRRMIGTRYHHNDTYATILDRGTFEPRIIPATKDGTPEGEPVFLTRESLEEKRRDYGVYTFGCQMLQNPTADSAMGFQEEWLTYWEPGNYGHMNLMILIDAAHSKRKTSDYTAMWVIGLAADKRYYVIDLVRDRLSLTERAAVLMALHRRYKPYFVGYERYGAQADIEHIQDLQKRQNYRFTITELGGPIPKDDRIRRLVPLFEFGRIVLPENLVKYDFEKRAVNLITAFKRDEYLAFPVGRHDDMIDALARIEDDNVDKIWPLNPEEVSTQPAWRRNLRQFGAPLASSMVR
jgi:predicted phage terminase large subunit-like protein